jgi:hypothetical protein
MAGPDVIKARPPVILSSAVKGYRPETMDTPAGYVLKTGPRRPASGFQSNTPTKAPGAIAKPMGTGTPDRIPSVNRRQRGGHTVKPPDRLGLPGRVIIPNTGISLPNSNR